MVESRDESLSAVVDSGHFGKAPRAIAKGEIVTFVIPPPGGGKPYFMTSDGMRSIHDDDPPEELFEDEE